MIRFIAIVDMNNNYKTQEYLLLASIYWTVILHQSISPFPSSSVGAVGLFTFLPQSKVQNLHI